jgi:hypothetical protein
MAYAPHPLPAGQVQALQQALQDLAHLPDARELVSLLCV